MESYAIDAQDVKFAYAVGRNRQQALRGVTLQVKTGEIFGLLGPNGAGKSTLLASMQGLIAADAGSVHVNGFDLRTHAAQAKQQLGIQLQRTALMEELTARELIKLYAALYNVYPSDTELTVLFQRLNLNELGNKTAKRMSGGQQQRLALALALVNNPKIVMLDEPTESLDPHARRAIWDIIRSLRAEGRTVLLTTHQMDEAEMLCDRVAIIDAGLIVACDTPAALVRQLAREPVLHAHVDVPLEIVRTLPDVRVVRQNGLQLEIESSAPQVTLAALYALATTQGRTIGAITLKQPNLEDVYLALTGKPLN
jgi:ABC-2 type transport system ATP-binding protein